MKYKINTFILLSYHWFKINNKYLKYIDESLELYTVEICNKYLQFNS